MTKRIILACSAGMSTSLLVSRMQKSAQERGIDVEIEAHAHTEARRLVKEQGADVLMLGPQVRYLLDEVSAELPDIPVGVINMSDYGLMNGKKVLDDVLDLIGGA